MNKRLSWLLYQVVGYENLELKIILPNPTLPSIKRKTVQYKANVAIIFSLDWHRITIIIDLKKTKIGQNY